MNTTSLRLLPAARIRMPHYSGEASIPQAQIRSRRPPVSASIAPAVKASIVTLDLEGVLVPEVWIAFAEATKSPELRLTTRDIPDYDVLMQGRLKILDEHKLKLRDIQNVIATLRPLEGALDFLNELRSVTQVILLSDTFQEFAQPLMRQLNWPTLLCHPP